ncbi:MAG TPA: hypothetical protein DCY48_03200 [Candidatus Magasanikbacteria bacterium]|nr:hypothetical protein [Candidatus Magasanikbacteria bacterium]
MAHSMKKTRETTYYAVGLGFFLVVFFVAGGFVWKKIGNSLTEQKRAKVIEDVPLFEKDDFAPVSFNDALELPLPSPEPQKIDTALPAKINLDVPFVPQAPEKIWTQPWQDACEEAVMIMMDAYYKEYDVSIPLAKEKILDAVQWQDERGWGVSIEIEKMRQMMEEIYGFTPDSGLTLRLVAYPTISSLKQFIANGQPILVVARGKDLHNPHFKNGGPEYHTLIIRGYTEEAFITNDPGTQFGENYMYPHEILLRAIHDWNNGDVIHGKPVVLVVE